MSAPWIIPTVTLAAIAVGWLAHHSLTPEPTAHAQTLRAQSPEQAQTMTAGDITPVDSELAAQDKIQQAEVFRLLESPRLEDQIRCLRAIEQMSAAELSAFASSNSHFTGQLFQRWAEIDPDGLIRAIQADPDNYRLHHGLYRYLVTHDPDVAFATLDQLTGHARDEAEKRIFSLLASHDPQRFVAEIQSGRSLNINEWSYQTLTRKLYQENPDYARSVIALIPPGSAQNMAWTGYFSAMAEDDPQGAVDTALRITDANAHTTILQSVYRSWMHRDIEAAMTSMAQMPESATKKELLQQQYWNAPRAEPAKTVAVFQRVLDGQQFDHFMNYYMSQVASEKPAEAAAIIDSLPYGEAFSASMRHVASQWAAQDPQAALQWLTTQSAGPERNQAYGEIIESFATHQPQAAMDYFMSLPTDDRTPANLRKLASGLGSYNNEIAADMIAQLDDPDMQREMMRGMMSNWANRDAPSAWQYAAEHDIDVSDNIGLMAFRWSESNPQEAAEWATSLEPGKSSQSAIYSTFKYWTLHSPDEASAAALALPEGDQRDTALAAASYAAMEYYPESAFSYAANIDDAEKRVSNVKSVLYGWVKQDPAAAEEALRQSDLHVDEINRLLKEVIQ
ncbi:hypothetical protein [Cerasicoccus frondis]|uniref:hypothetical protein n=1 Tax=Cerasicoccus frondis TaxID=490090 RepID=UPI002852C1EB|nr:hypothetical protein [Cerasicoccus frondis]